MKWQLTSLIICLCFSTALAVRCYHCSNDCETSPLIGNCSTCYHSYTVVHENGVRHEEDFRSCIDYGLCLSFSINMGIAKSTSISKCCNSDLCNGGPNPAVDTRPNGKQCHFCIGENCLGNVHCEGTEDHCFMYLDAATGKDLYIKGCASKSLCDASSLRPNLAATKTNETKIDMRCCKGNLCNSAESVTLSFLLTLLFLLSSFLLH